MKNGGRIEMAAIVVEFATDYALFVVRGHYGGRMKRRINLSCAHHLEAAGGGQASLQGRILPRLRGVSRGLPATRKRALIDQLFTALVWLAANTNEYY